MWEGLFSEEEEEFIILLTHRVSFNHNKHNTCSYADQLNNSMGPKKERDMSN